MALFGVRVVQLIICRLPKMRKCLLTGCQVMYGWAEYEAHNRFKYYNNIFIHTLQKIMVHLVSFIYKKV